MSDPADAVARWFDLSGRVALVTGASRGLGFAIARGLAAAGARVVLNGRDVKALDEAAAKIARVNAAVDTAPFDVTDQDAVQDGIAAIAARVGPVDILVNNAGIQIRHPYVEFPKRDWDAVIATN